ncbi:hypothetical protein [uncultured Brevibacillus sp.]|uniref:hypothetical protein n=1 Tax=uncultured Brevibacillus sp. TaxID=169970 RepID=UPI0025997941|nr:hypothetical protein [uncultured Brevibacillus sp.]
MYEETEKPDWNDLFNAWKYSCQQMNSSIVSYPNILEIKVASPGWDWQGNEHIDWWPNELLVKRRGAIEEQGIRGLYLWEKTRVGTRTTAELLWNLRDDPEGMFKVWVGASMWDKEKDLPEFWRGKIYRMVKILSDEVLEQLRGKNLFTWNHLSRGALPITVHDNWIINEALKPTNYEQLIGISSIESILTHANWTIVRLVVD